MLWFRYKLTVKGLENLNKSTLNKPGGILFLANHPAMFVDPVSVILAAWPKFKIRPLTVEYMYYNPAFHWVMRLIDALPIPNFSTTSNSLKKRKSEAVFQEIINALRGGEHFLIYPGAGLKHTNMESIGGASGVHQVIQKTPEANVVLVRIKGLWGSSFSRALTHRSPPIMPTILKGIKESFKNLLFFNPRREIIVEFEAAPEDFPWNASKMEMNRWLENWYNRPDGMSPQKGKYPGESLVLVSYSIWKKKLAEVHSKPEMEDTQLSLEDIPEDIKQKVINKVAEMTDMNATLITPDMNLSTELGMDSLDTAELIAFLQDQFDIKGIPVAELTTVGRLMGLAAGQIACEEIPEEDKGDLKKWNRPVQKERAMTFPGETFPEVFLNICNAKGNAIACGDMRLGVMTYAEMKLRVIILADKIRHAPGKYIGILLPASAMANLLVLACQMAGKVPLLINWTVGPRHLESVVKLSDVQVVFSSWTFIERLEAVELNGLENKLVMLEDYRHNIGLVDKLRALWRSKQSTKTLLKKFGLDTLSNESLAVLLFTSGTESMPKGVPLTHHNILSNHRAVLKVIDVSTTDVLLAILPPFHSFGFTVGLLGVLSGIKTAYSPDPTDGKKLAAAFEKWGATVVCGAPTFIKGMMKIAEPAQLNTMRLCVTGAEKAPKDLLLMLEKMGKMENFLEGYGITECSPVLTLTVPGEPRIGVGKVVPGSELLIVSPEHEEPLPTGQQGHILAKGPNIFSGYINPGISAPFTTVNGTVWYKTGDLGYLDEQGNLTITGRIKRFIKVGGEMVSLASIEDALLHMALAKGWSDAEEGPTLAVCAKEQNGDKPKIYLFSKFEATVEEVNKSLKDAGFSNLVKVSSVTQLPEIPVMGTGKINYRALESKYLT